MMSGEVRGGSLRTEMGSLLHTMLPAPNRSTVAVYPTWHSGHSGYYKIYSSFWWGH